MGLLENIFSIGVIGWGIHQLKKSIRGEDEEQEDDEEDEEDEEQERRRSILCEFSDGISETDFELMANRAAEPILSLDVDVKGPFIIGKVQSRSGISEWYFIVDFNDYGHITGQYWITSDNSDSDIPEHYAERVASFIENYDPDDYGYEEFDESSSSDDSQSSGFSGNFCPYCGKKITVANPIFCAFCGKRLT